MSDAAPLPQKLGIREGAVVAILRAPEGFDRTLGDLPTGVSLRSRAAGTNDVVVFFTRSKTELADRFRGLARLLTPAGGLWIAYPKKASGVPTDLSFEAVQRIGLEGELVDNKSCAIDDVWTAVRFVVRLEDRGG
ncbi:MAG: DUF3052 domain-containing protein [Actinomycetota bacterium]